MNRAPDSRRFAQRGAAVAVTATALTVSALLPRMSTRARLVANLATAAGSVGIARRARTSWRALGLAADDARRGLLIGLATVAPVTGVVATSVAVPRLRALYDDARVTEPGHGRAAFEVLVRIPLETALAEEVLFRGALLGTAQEAWGTPVALALSSAAFGVWHVMPALESHRRAAATADLVPRSVGPSGHVLATIAVTAVAGAGFAALRLRSRSVLASVVAHAGVNACAYVAARWAHRPPRVAAQA